MSRYFAPASTGNLSVGFDLLGAAFEPTDGQALGDELAILGEGDVLELSVSGRYVHQLPADLNDNLVAKCFYAFEQAVGRTLPRLRLELVKHLPVGSGLGSSACSIVVALYAFNQHFGRPLSDQVLLQLMAELEGGVSGSVHYDNVAPSFFGGLQLMLQDSPQICRSLPWFEHWRVVLCYPGTVLSTKAARAVLPKELSLKHSIAFAGMLSRFVSALYSRDEQDALAALQDLVAEPARRSLMPELEPLRAALMAEGVGHVGISGAGPTIFAVCRNEQQAQFAASYLQTQYAKNQDAMTVVCRLAQQGARALQDQDTGLSRCN
ncbi:homoserine kinase [Rheinheimera sp.]|uniref:homoserine kinase n=1 Tax=Rheinheimera sp. TaxID=1869214 RepID=UPI003AF76714